MRFALPSAVRLAWVGPDLVALTLDDGQYLCLPDLAPLVLRRADGEIEIADPALASDLAAIGLLDPAAGASAARAPLIPAPLIAPSLIPAPRRDLPAVAPSARRRRAAVAMARAWWAMVRGYYGRPFRRLLVTAQRGRPPSPRSDEAGLARRVADFDALLPWTPFQGACLFRSFMLLNLLRQAGYDAVWMFGVRTWPFQAHCWLQAEDLVLGDAVERVRPFTPILAV